MKGLFTLCLVFLLCGCTASEPEWKLEIQAPTAAITNPVPEVEDNLAESGFDVGYTMYSDVDQSHDRLLTQADIDAALNSKFNIENFTDLTTLPIYHKRALSEAEMKQKADLLAEALGAEITDYDYFEPLDFHAEDFEIAHETELMSTQRELLAVFAQGNILVKQNGSVTVDLTIPYSDTFKNEISESGIRMNVQAVYDQYLKKLVDFKNPIIQIDSSSHLIDGKIQTRHHCYIYNESAGTLTDQLLTAAFQRIDIVFDDTGVSEFTLSSLNAEYAGNAVLLDPYEAIFQMQQIDPELNLPLDIRAAEIVYAYQDYQYDALPIYRLYGYDIHGQGIVIDLPAVLVNAELVYEAPRIYTELHLPLHYNCIYY